MSRAEEISKLQNKVKQKVENIKLPRDVDLGTIKFQKGVDLNIFLRDVERRAKWLTSILRKNPEIQHEIIRGEHG